MKIYILFIMLFLHIVDDYYFQGILAKLKCKSWWETNAPDPMYKNDYKVALIEHGFSWTFMIMLPLMFKMNSVVIYYAAFLINWIIHVYVDNLKANLRKCNLTVDQSIHVAQVIITWIITFHFVEV